MTVNSTYKAWVTANEIFPTDYIKDEKRSKAAGYDIYYSTAESVNAWISDLGNRLEVNFPNGKTVNIWIVYEEKKTREPKPEKELKEIAEKSAKKLLSGNTLTEAARTHGAKLQR